MSVGTYQLEYDSPSAALFIKEAQKTGKCGYIAWVAEDKLANLATICWSEELGGSLSKTQDYFNAYMRLEAYGLGNDSEGGRGANCNDKEAFAKELEWIMKTAEWLEQQLATLHYFTTEQEQEGEKFDMKGKTTGKAKGKGKKKGKDQAQAQEHVEGGGEEGKGKGKGNTKGKTRTLDITKMTTFPYMFEWLKVGDKLPQGEYQGEYQSRGAWYKCYNDWKKIQLESANYTHKVSMTSMFGNKGKGKGKDKDQEQQQQWHQQQRQWHSNTYASSSSSNWNSSWKQDPWHQNKKDPWSGSRWDEGYKNLSWRPKKEAQS